MSGIPIKDITSITKHADHSIDLLEYVTCNTSRKFINRVGIVNRQFQLNRESQYEELYKDPRGFSIQRSKHDPTYQMVSYKFLAMYDIDCEHSTEKEKMMASFLEVSGMDYVIYKSLSGYHVFTSNYKSDWRMDFNNPKSVRVYLRIGYKLGADPLHMLYSVLGKSCCVRVSKKTKSDPGYAKVAFSYANTDIDLRLMNRLSSFIHEHVIILQASQVINKKRGLEQVENYTLDYITPKNPKIIGNMKIVLPSSNKKRKHG